MERTTHPLPQAKTPLDAVMHERGIKAVNLGLRAKIGESRMSRYRNGLIPPPDAQKAIAKALGLKVEELWP